MSGRPDPEPTWLGATNEDIARAVLHMHRELEAIARLPGSPADRLARLDRLYLGASHIERMALREAAFFRVCGVEP